MTKRSIRRQVLAGISAVGAPMLLSSIGHAQTWPAKPIRIIVGYPPGGLTDIFARAYGEHLSNRLGQQVVVENRTGAGGSLAAQAVKNAPPDGYTLMFTISTTMIMNKVLYKSLPYDPDKEFCADFQHVGRPPAIDRQQKLGITNLKGSSNTRTNKVTLGTRRGLVFAHCGGRTESIFGLKMEAVALPGRGADVAGRRCRCHRGWQQQRRIATSVLQSGHRGADCRAANQAHAHPATWHVPGTGRADGLPAQGVHLPRRRPACRPNWSSACRT
jgi:hypothetical protein